MHAKKNESNFQIICMHSSSTGLGYAMQQLLCSEYIEHRYCTSTNCVCVCTQSHNTANVFTSLNLNSSFQYTRYACTHDAARCKTLNVVVLAGLSTAAEFEKKNLSVSCLKHRCTDRPKNIILTLACATCGILMAIVA